MRKIICLSLALIIACAQSMLHSCCRIYHTTPKSFLANDFGQRWNAFYHALQEKYTILDSLNIAVASKNLMDDEIIKAIDNLSQVTITGNVLQPSNSIPANLASLHPLAHVENTSKGRVLEFTNTFLTNIFSPDNIANMLQSLEERNLLTSQCIAEIFSTPPSFIVVEQDHPTEQGRVTLRAYVNPSGWSEWAYWNFCVYLSGIKNFAGSCAYGAYSGVCGICSSTLGAGSYCLQQTGNGFKYCGSSFCSGCSWTWSKLTMKNIVYASLIIIVMVLLYEGIIYHELLWQECIHAINALPDGATIYSNTIGRLFSARGGLPPQLPPTGPTCSPYLDKPLNLTCNPINILLQNFNTEAQSIIRSCIQTLANNNVGLKIHQGVSYKEFITSLHAQLVEAGAISMANYLQSAKLLASNYLAT